MPSAECPHCHRTINYKNSQAGQAKCPGCKGSILLVPFEEEAPRPAPRPPSAPELEFDEDERTGRAPERLGREPWYYGFLAVIATIIIASALAFFALVGALGVMYALHEIDRGRPGAVLMLLALLLGSAFYLVLFVALGALILLLVDVARNVRKIRQNTHRG
jgi:hypothetical protein